MDAIVAVYSDWGIGDGQTQPVVISADRVRFREVTRGATVILGRKTLEDFPGKKPLKGRRNIVLSRNCPEIEGAEVARSVEEAIEATENDEKCLVIGGSSVFSAFFPYLSKVYITKIDCAPASSCFFPDLDSLDDWECTEEGPVSEENGVKYRFCTYERINYHDQRQQIT